ncbi:MAG: c-type cytochrome [Myxococcales bacterium]|nr:c-type cytochrome [Myxococcales bacterium]
MRLSKSTLSLSLVCVAAVALGLTAGDEAQGRKMPVSDMMFEEPFIGEFGGGGFFVTDFRVDGMPLGDAAAPTVAPHAGSHGSTVVAGQRGLLTIDRDSGELIHVDRRGQVLSRLQFHSGAGELVRDGNSGKLFLADRSDDRVAVISVDGEGKLKVLTGAKVREPHGLGLSPDGKTLYVTSAADHQLVAIDTETMGKRWSLELAAEPRGVAISADGKQALVGFLSTGAVARVAIDGSSPSADYLALDPANLVGADPFSNEVVVQEQLQEQQGQRFAGGLPSPADTQDLGRRFARNAFAVGFVGDGIAVVPHQLSAPHIPSFGGEDMGTYGGGGGFTAPITHRLAMIDSEDGFSPDMVFADIGVHQPRAMAYDAADDTLYLAGYGDDRVIAVAEVSRSTVHLGWVAFVDNAGGCGVDGLAVDGGKLWAHCELSRNLIQVGLGDVETLGAPSVVPGAELAATKRSAAEARGAALFRRGMDPRMSTGGFMACASCHPEGRSDGLSWRIEGHNLQTPMLSGRLMGAHPFKWDGKDADLPTSLTNTIGRLGGGGLQANEIRDLQAFLESLPKPETPTADKSALARGEELFESSGCVACHDGPRYADGVQHDLATNIGAVDTPSLIGLAHSAPYYHDGSARTLRALLTDKGSIHDMGGTTAQLSGEELGDLVTYLESL